MATKMTKAQLEKMLSVAESKIDTLNLTIRKMYGEIGDCKTELETARPIVVCQYRDKRELNDKIADLNATIQRRNKTRDEVDWPSIERMLSQFGFRRDQPASLKLAISVIVQKLYGVRYELGNLK